VKAVLVLHTAGRHTARFPIPPNSWLSVTSTNPNSKQL